MLLLALNQFFVLFSKKQQKKKNIWLILTYFSIFPGLASTQLVTWYTGLPPVPRQYFPRTGLSQITALRPQAFWMSQL